MKGKIKRKAEKEQKRNKKRKINEQKTECVKARKEEIKGKQQKKRNRKRGIIKENKLIQD